MQLLSFKTQLEAVFLCLVMLTVVMCLIFHFTGGPYPAFGFLCSNPDNARRALRAQQMPVKVKMLRPEMVSRRISKKGKIGM